jgi:hypothetical protein
MFSPGNETAAAAVDDRPRGRGRHAPVPALTDSTPPPVVASTCRARNAAPGTAAVAATGGRSGDPWAARATGPPPATPGSVADRPG